MTSPEHSPNEGERPFFGIDDRSLSIPQYSRVCTFCAHAIPAQYRRCRAFDPDPIPLEIWTGENDHTQPYPGDHSLLFEPREGTARREG
jgi:hypothetical protein